MSGKGQTRRAQSATLLAMVLDADSCYQAMKSRDRRFEGHFVIAVVTTGIYCRPGCPARSPLRKNVHFFPHVAAAEEAGFRPCLRCRPDASPELAWGTQGTVARALRLISEGALEDGGVDALAARLGMGSRHLRRLFLEHVGAPPLSVALTRRAHFARKLLEQTQLPIAEVALGAGFSSLRRFNAAMRRTFRCTPSELRRKAKGVASGQELLLRLPYRPPYDWEAIAGFLRERATPGVEVVAGRSYRRTVSFDGEAGAIEVEHLPGEPALALRVWLPSTRHLLAVAERARRLFDLAADPLAIARVLEKDRALAGIVSARPGLRLPGAWDPFEVAVRAILGQQVTVRGATTLAGRLVQTFGQPLPAPMGEGLTHLFPGPAALAKADLRRIGLPGPRALAISGLAEAVAKGELVLAPAASAEPLAERLVQLKGIGPWTAQYVSMRLGEPDALPASDLGLRKALGVEAGEVEARAERWRPWRSYAAMYLWTRGPVEARAQEERRHAEAG